MPSRFSLRRARDGIRLSTTEGTEDTGAQSRFLTGLNLRVPGVLSGGALAPLFSLSPPTLSQQPQTPIIVKLVETPRDPTGLASVMIGALGLTGVLVLIALVLGLLAGGILYFARSRIRR